MQAFLQSINIKNPVINTKVIQIRFFKAKKWKIKTIHFPAWFKL